jgi:hypothetical protein
MRALAVLTPGLMLATTATSCILLAKPAYEKVKEKVSDDDEKE